MLISDAYREQIRLLHQLQEGWGESNQLAIVKQIQFAILLGTKDVLDYGCGKGQLAHYFPWPIKEYDPGIPGKENGNVPAYFVICHDVLEHIEPEYLEEVLKDLHRCTKQVLFVTIALAPAEAILPDGRNAHLIIQPMEWWETRLKQYFYVVSRVHITKPENKTEVELILVPKKDIEIC